jgi:hypothetical protein
VSTGFGGGEVDARKPGSASHPALEDAPGSYVKQAIEPAAQATSAPAAPPATPAAPAARAGRKVK